MAQWKSNPFADFGGSEHSTGFSFSPHASRSSNKNKPLTTQQLLAIELALHKNKSGSFWDEVKHAGGEAFHPVGWTLDKLMRPLYGVAGAVTEGREAENKNFEKGDKYGGFRGNVFEAIGKGFVHGIEGKTHHTMSDYLRANPQTAGFAKKHKILAGAAGFGLDVAADPLTYVTGGAGRVLTKSAEHANLVKAGDFALHGPDDLESLKQAKQALARGGKNYEYRHALAAERLSHLTGEGADPGALDRLHIAQSAANAEKKRVEKFLPQYHIGARGHGLPITPTYIGGTRVVPALPKLDNAIEKAPLGGAFLEGFRNKFIRAADETPEAHAARMTRQHIAEQHAQENVQLVRDAMRGVKINERKALKALHYGETVKNFVLKTKNGRFRLNEGAISKLQREGKLDADQVRFLRRWFAATQLLHQKDEALGVLYHHTGEAGQLYVPHLVDKLGRPLSDLQKNVLTKATHQHSRGKGGLSVLQLAEKAKAGELGRGVETDPFKLLAHTARRRAEKQADMALATQFARNLSIPTRIVDTARLGKVQAALDQLGIDHSIHHNGQIDAMAAAHEAEQQFLHDHEQAFQTKLADLEKKLRSHKFRNNHKLKKANVARIQKQIVKLHEQHIKDLEAISKEKHAPLNQHIAPHLELASQHDEAMKAINEQAKGLETVAKHLAVGKKNRAYSKASHITVPGLVDDNGHALAFEREVGDVILKYQKIASGEDQAIEDFSKGWKSFLAKWKLAVTSVNPGYRIRNSMSDVWAMYLSGVPMHKIPVYAAKAAKLIRDAKRMDSPNGIKAYKAVVEAYHHGILSGLYQGDVQAVAGYVKYSGTKRGMLRRGHALQAGTKMMQDFNAHVENLGRLTHYLYRREELHESAVQAAFKVKQAHFDYEDLTPFEQKRMKAVAPFYTWARKNIPFQVKALVSAPGKYATLPKFMAESEKASDSDQGNIVPGYIQQGLGFQVPFGKHNYLLPPIGAQDLQIFDSPAGAVQRTEQLVNPAIAFPFELATNKNLFTGGDIKSDTHERNPVSSIGANLLKFIPGSDVGQTSRNIGGKRVSGPGANPYFQFALGQIPIARQLGLNYSGINKERAGQNALSYFGGLSVQNVDPAQQKMIESIVLQDELKREVTSLRDAGLLPPAKSKKSKNQKLIDEVLFGRRGR